MLKNCKFVNEDDTMGHPYEGVHDYWYAGNIDVLRLVNKYEKYPVEYKGAGS